MKMSVFVLLCALACNALGKEVNIEVTDKTLDADDYFAVIEPVYYSVRIDGSPAQYENDLAQFSREQRYVLACHWYLGEVFNGGHDQFYDNDTGIVWKDARAGLLAVGAGELAAILDESAQRLGGAPSLVWEERQRQLDAANVDFSDLDQKLFRAEERIDLGRKLMEYIRAHRDKFYFSGTIKK